MTIREAREVCTAAELALVVDSRSRSKKSADQLVRAVQRARKLRDKYRDLAAEQRRRGRGKSAADAGDTKRSGNARTFRKAEIFADVLGRFEEQLANAAPKARAGRKGGAERGGAKASRVKASRKGAATRARESGRDTRKKAFDQTSRQRVRRALAVETFAAAAETTGTGGGVRSSTSPTKKRTSAKTPPEKTAAAMAPSTAKSPKSPKSPTTSNTSSKSSKSSRSSKSSMSSKSSKPASAPLAARPTVTSAPRVAAGKSRPTKRTAVPISGRGLGIGPVVDAGTGADWGVATAESAMAAAGIGPELTGVKGRIAKVQRRGTRNTARAEAANQPKILAHVAATNRRSQAKRDARGS